MNNELKFFFLIIAIFSFGLGIENLFGKKIFARRIAKIPAYFLIIFGGATLTIAIIARIADLIPTDIPTYSIFAVLNYCLSLALGILLVRRLERHK